MEFVFEVCDLLICLIRFLMRNVQLRLGIGKFLAHDSLSIINVAPIQQLRVQFLHLVFKQLNPRVGSFRLVLRLLKPVAPIFLVMTVVVSHLAGF